MRSRMFLSTLLTHILLIPLLFGGLIYIVQQGYQAQFVNDVRFKTYLISKVLGNATQAKKYQIKNIIDDLVISGHIVYAEVTFYSNERSIVSDYQLPEFRFVEDFYFGEHDDDVYYIEVPVDSEAESALDKLKLGFDETGTKDQIAEAYKRGVYLLLFYLLVGLGLAGFIATQLTKPLQNLRDQAHRISSGEFENELNVSSSIVEVRNLADDLNQMRHELVKQAHALQYQALHDALTGLFNREMLKARVEQACKKSRRDGSSFALLLMDLDRFKEVNDTLGHEYGDNVLQIVAEKIRNTIRDYDTVARLGGDEFAILLDVDDYQVANTVATNLMQELGKPFEVNECTLHIGVSIGIALYPDDGHDYLTLLQRADVAMYRAKTSGLNVARYEKTFDPHSPELLSLTGELRKQLNSDEFELYYQPKIDLYSNRIVGAEGLLRWQHQHRGFMLPDQFIPIAEKSGLVEALTARVLRDAAMQLRRWHEKGIKISLSINISVKNLLNPDFIKMVEDILKEIPFPKGYLIMEITESALLTDPFLAKQILDYLNKHGIHFSIDDFGTGYSSLAYLKRLPVTELKIDKIFIKDLVVNENDKAIVKATIDMARGLGLNVVAEGIEGLQVLQLLSAMGCDTGQGYYFSPPVPRELFEKMLQSDLPMPQSSGAS